MQRSDTKKSSASSAISFLRSSFVHLSQKKTSDNLVSWHYISSAVFNARGHGFFDHFGRFWVLSRPLAPKTS